MLIVRAFQRADLSTVMAWPPYEGDMAQMDYALRQDGWLMEQRGQPGTHLLAAELDGELIAFTLLLTTAPGAAELRIAIRNDRTGQGLGAEIMVRTLRAGFDELGLERIHLIVRTNNQRGINLYRRLGFCDRGEVSKPVQGAMVDFYCMDIGRDEFYQQLQREKEVAP